MSRILGSFLPFLLALAAGCTVVGGNGEVETRALDVGAFEKVEVSHALKAVWTVGAATGKATLSGESNLLEWIEVREAGGTLFVEVKDDGVILAMNEPVTFAFTAPALKSVDLSGASQLEVDGTFATENFALFLSGASRATLPSIEAAAVVFELSGESQLEVGGVTGDLTIRASGASHVDGAELVSRRLGVDLSGASFAHVHVEDEFDGALSGASRLELEGAATGDVDTSGGSTVERL